MNNKGFTVVEVLVSFTLISIISIFLFQIIYVVRNIYINKAITSQLSIAKNNISNAINKYFYEHIISRIVENSDGSITLTFNNGMSKTLSIDIVNKSIIYDKLIQPYPKETDLSKIELSVDTLLSNQVMYKIRI